MISVRNIVKDYIDDDVSTRALMGVSFEIKKGEFVAIMGPSGSGKSTLLHIISLLDRAPSGEYMFSGKSISQFSDKELAHFRNKEVGFVFQSFNLLSRLSVYENVELPLVYSSVAPRERQRLIERAVKEVGLEEKLHVETGKLSGGQKQRVAIARALVNDPNVIFADEPTGNLDSKSGAQVMEILAQLNSAGRTIVLVTHETHTAEFADRLIELRDGEIESDKPIAKRRHTAEQFIK